MYNRFTQTMQIYVCNSPHFWEQSSRDLVPGTNLCPHQLQEPALQIIRSVRKPHPNFHHPKPLAAAQCPTPQTKVSLQNGTQAKQQRTTPRSLNQTSHNPHRIRTLQQVSNNPSERQAFLAAAQHPTPQAKVSLQKTHAKQQRTTPRSLNNNISVVFSFEG
jgi:hypothetical protein